MSLPDFSCLRGLRPGGWRSSWTFPESTGGYGRWQWTRDRIQEHLTDVIQRRTLTTSVVADRIIPGDRHGGAIEAHNRVALIVSGGHTSLLMLTDLARRDDSSTGSERTSELNRHRRRLHTPRKLRPLIP